jgi:hypothetical protein
LIVARRDSWLFNPTTAKLWAVHTGQWTPFADSIDWMIWSISTMAVVLSRVVIVSVLPPQFPNACISAKSIFKRQHRPSCPIQ